MDAMLSKNMGDFEKQALGTVMACRGCQASSFHVRYYVEYELPRRR
jgi:hypothetical protein